MDGHALMEKIAREADSCGSFHFVASKDPDLQSRIFQELRINKLRLRVLTTEDYRYGLVDLWL